MYALWIHARDISTQANADAVLKQCQAAGITDVFFQLLDDNGRAHYKTTLFTKCPDTGTFDPLAYLASSPNVKAHAWICAGTDPLYAHPEFGVRATRSLPTNMPNWADFTVDKVRQFCTDWCTSIAKAYPSVGIHLDYIRWHTDFGDAKLSWATATPITQTVQQIAAAIPGATLTAAVSSDPTGTLFGNLQAWGSWVSMVDMFTIMAYPNSVSQLQTMMARSAAYDKNQIAVGLSGLYFTYSPYTETRIVASVLADLVNWARGAGYKHFAWFDYTKISADQYSVIAQLKPTDKSGPAVQGLITLAQTLRARADVIDQHAQSLATEVTNLRAQAGEAERIAKALA